MIIFECIIFNMLGTLGTSSKPLILLEVFYFYTYYKNFVFYFSTETVILSLLQFLTKIIFLTCSRLHQIIPLKNKHLDTKKSKFQPQKNTSYMVPHENKKKSSEIPRIKTNNHENSN